MWQILQATRGAANCAELFCGTMEIVLKVQSIPKKNACEDLNLNVGLLGDCLELVAFELPDVTCGH